MSVHIIGGGLAGSEAAWQAASAGVPVVLYEMRPVRPTAVHKTDRLAELVCSNSFRGDKLDNAVGLLKEEMRRLGSLVMRAFPPAPRSPSTATSFPKKSVARSPPIRSLRSAAKRSARSRPAATVP
jgi:tRNA:m(5)U-54 methyltransferase